MQEQKSHQLSLIAKTAFINVTYNIFSFFFKPKMNKYNAQCCFTYIVKIVLLLPVIFILQNIGLSGSLSAQGCQSLRWDY